uniref:Uncharacterized protein n=1 Tax=Salmo trutta TaxID=8032 RepID=A0A674DBV1_SALTR
MGSISFWMCLILTICTWNKTIGCRWMRTLPRSPSMFQMLSNSTITMLQKMVGYRDNGRIVFISQTLNAIEKLYSSGKYDSTAWDQKVVDEFMIGLHRQTSELDQCVSQLVLPREYIHQVGIYSYVLTQHVSILKYYMCVSFMQEYSASGWEDIRNVVMSHMLRLVTIPID